MGRRVSVSLKMDVVMYLEEGTSVEEVVQNMHLSTVTGFDRASMFADKVTVDRVEEIE